MPTKSFRYAAIAMTILDKLLGTRFSVSGIENLPKHPVLFVANHFTRSETFFVPYIINKYTKRQVRCLADAGLFHGTLGKFLNSVGTVSTKNPNRDKIILQDLITGDYDWMIYPEGSMIKSKEIKRGEGFVHYTPDRVGRVRTGSAILALKSEIYRKDILEAFKNKQDKILKKMKKDTGVEYQKSLHNKSTHIVPVNITYYPIRPGKNHIQSLAAKFVKKIPKRVIEELEIEGNLLLDAEINIHFGKPINIKDYIKEECGLIYQIPLIKNETKSNFVLKYFKHRLTVAFMKDVYCDIQINLDHLFAAVLFHIPEEEISIDYLKRAIYLSASMIAHSHKYRMNSSIMEESLVKMFVDEPHKDFDSVFKLAKDQGLISKGQAGKIKINKLRFHEACDFHEIRRENTLVVIANEFSLMQVASDIVRKNTKLSEKLLGEKVFKEITKKDAALFEADYKQYFDKKFSKSKTVGAPFFLESQVKTACKIKKVGILLCHGYKSSPKEVAALAKFLNGFGFKVYAVRLRGHGTAPINMQDIRWEDWYEDVQRGYAALHNICSKIVIVGFSTGGLLGLLSAANKKNNETYLVAINSALKLMDIKAKMVPGINIWNDVLEKFKITKGKFEFIDDEPENPKINYSRNYLKGVQELGQLMDKCEKNLKKVKVPTLIIQAKKDPVVNPLSGQMIYKKISADKKFLVEPNFSNHVIVNGKNKEEVFELIRKFLSDLNLL